MVRILSLLPSLALLSSTFAAGSAVIDLLPSNFDDIVLKSGKPALVEFFAPWCGHCKNLAPVYEELAQSFQHASDKVTIAKVDADAHKSLGKRFGVQGFPTLKWFDGTSDKPVDYNSGRDLDSLSKFVADKASVRAKTPKKTPSTVVMLTDSSFKEQIGGNRAAFIAFTAPWCGHCKSLAPTWESLANDFANEPGILIGKIDAEADNAKATAKAHNVEGFPTIMFFPANTTTPLPKYSGERDETSLVNYVNEHAGTYRLPGGKLNAKAGTIDTLNSIAVRVSSGGEKVAAELKAAIETSKEKSKEYYAKVAKKVGENKGYAVKELKRLEGMLAKGGLAQEKIDDLTRRTNVLRVFMGDTAAESGKDEL